MATDPGSLKIIAAWLARLARITKTPADSAMDAEKMTDLTTMLGKAFPSGAFTTASLEAVAANHPWFPAYADLRLEVEKWWGQNRPQVRKIAGPPGAEHLAPPDRLWFDFWHIRVGEIERGHAEDQAGRPLDPYSGWIKADRARANLASLLRKQSPAAWRIISGHDDTVAEKTDADRAAVAESVQAALRNLSMGAATASPRSAPLGDQVAAVRTSIGAAPVARPLAPDQLAAARAAQLRQAPPAREWVPD
jgi:hypothetical protein